MQRCRWAVLTAFVLAAFALRAAENAARLTLVYPCRPATAAITVDGQLDPAEWAAAPEVGGFRLSGSEALAPDQTFMRVLYDARCLYLGVRCAESSMKTLKTPTADHDGPFWNDDAVEFFLDPAHDHESYWQFAVTARGTRYENRQGDSNWNANWQAATQHGRDGWSIEMAVPFADLGLPAPTPGAFWGFNLCRERQAGGRLELHNWANVERVFNAAVRFGHLAFVAADWTSTAESIVRAARPAGGEESRVFVADGYWRLVPGQTPERLTYRDVLRAAERNIGPYFDELRKTYVARPDLPLRAEFGRIETDSAKAQALIAGDEAVSAETWARTQGFYDGVGARLETLYWRIRLVLLNESM